MAPAPVSPTTRTWKGPSHGGGDGCGSGCGRISSAPSSIHGEARANKSLERSAGACFAS
jgi:hypothetical protein